MMINICLTSDTNFESLSFHWNMNFFDQTGSSRYYRGKEGSNFQVDLHSQNSVGQLEIRTYTKNYQNRWNSFNLGESVSKHGSGVFFFVLLSFLFCTISQIKLLFIECSIVCVYILFCFWDIVQKRKESRTKKKTPEPYQNRSIFTIFIIDFLAEAKCGGRPLVNSFTSVLTGGGGGGGGGRRHHHHGEQRVRQPGDGVSCHGDALLCAVYSDTPICVTFITFVKNAPYTILHINHLTLWTQKWMICRGHFASYVFIAECLLSAWIMYYSLRQLIRHVNGVRDIEGHLVLPFELGRSETKLSYMGPFKYNLTPRGGGDHCLL